jgi:predicted HAD superfamily Cof-like phosphohydrolase
MISEEDLEAMRPRMPHEKVADFIVAFGASLDPRVWINLVEEELSELYKEKPRTPEHLKELCDLLYVTTGLRLTAPDHISMLLSEEEARRVGKQQAKVERALKEYLAFYGDGVFMEAFDRVHNSNMSKLGADGKPIYREDGKVLKGPNYKAPDLSDLVEKP